jgi:type IV pilus assembly protein PilQ
MGDVVQKIRRVGLRRATPVAMLLVALAVACSSSPKPPARAAAPSPEPAAAAPARSAPPPMVLESIDLREGAPGMVVDLTASGPLVWTSYRDPDGDLVVELPNSVPGSDLAHSVAGEGMVTGITVEAEDGGLRPLTRLVVGLKGEVEHSLAAEGNVLRLELLPVPSGEEVALSYEPLPEEEAPPTAPAQAPPAAAQPQPARQAAPAPMALAGMGTADNPRVAPPPAGPPASRLRGVEVQPGGTILVGGDGQFAYSTFRLEDPERFVIDLTGVVNTAGTSTVEVDSEFVRRVRMAQFKPLPEPVSRVVFDLEEAAVPVIERTASGLSIRFSAPGTVPPPPAAEVTVAAGRPPAPAPAETMPAAGEETPAPAEPLVEQAAPAPAEVEVAAAAPVPAPPPEEMPAPAMAAPQAAPPEAPAQAAPPQAAPEKPAAPRSAPPAPVPSPRVSPPPPTPATSEAEMFGGPGGAAAMPTAGETKVATKVFGAQTIAGGERTYTGEPISMSLRDADVVETLRSFAAISGLSIVVQPEVKGSVTVELDNVPWDQALEQILKINRLGYELEGTIMRIAPISVLKAEAEEQQQLAQAKALQVPLRTVMRRLSYANANDVAGLLRGQGGLLSQRGEVLVDRRTNTLILQELPTYIDTVIAIIEEIDTPEPQVMIEARIIETTKRFTRSLGVNWSVSGEASARFGNTTGLVFPNNVTGSGGVNLVTGGRNGFIDLSLGNVLNTFNLDVSLQAAETEGLIKILSAPKVAVLNNESANIQSGLQIPVQTIANNTVTVQFINATLSLDVTPHVTAEGTVLMDINIRKREPQLAFAVAGAANAPIATKEARTRVIVRDGGTTVIGGIYEISSDQGEDRVPGLANIPIIGHLFKNKRRTDENKELLIFITPRVVNL